MNNPTRYATNFPHALVPTVYGTVAVVFPDENHCHVDGNHHCCAKQTDDCFYLTINGVEYGVSLHLWNNGGRWEIMCHDNNVPMLWVSRVDSSGVYTTPSARSKILTVLVPQVCKWIEENAEELLLAAEGQRLGKELSAVREELSKLDIKDAELRVKRMELNTQTNDWERRKNAFYERNK